ncbi:hypothetical protein IG631_21597 [Alternaria alternata]|nr:hypothetical protein IG631_21597 [Alternaria alternata]
MKRASRVAQLSGHGEAHDIARVVRIAAGWRKCNRFELEDSPKDSIMALCKISEPHHRF